MKDAAVTVRLPAGTRKRLETLARREGRSLSGQVEWLLGLALDGGASTVGARRVRRLAGVLAGGLTPTLAGFRLVRTVLSGSLARRTGRNAEPRR
jgi:hypothetical protein